jgi:hypothetical protein
MDMPIGFGYKRNSTTSGNLGDRMVDLAALGFAMASTLRTRSSVLRALSSLQRT